MLGPLSAPWPWYVAGPILGLFVPALLLAGNRLFGVSATLRDLCAACLPGGPEHFRYNWRQLGGWNLLFILGIAIGGAIAAQINGPQNIQLAEPTRQALAALNIHDLTGLAPRELFNWQSLATTKGFLTIIVGGFLVGFGTAYAGGCTSGHAIAGLADRQLPSLIAVCGFFAGGLLATHVLFPWIF
jgi:uncharacterized membrane protein YedE/YeeE